ncbi:MAG: ABC transporter ATP-binding protein [Bacillota bacterium]|nr:ABC transporter ATP-binding protein [Bacillota bacterium]
MDIIIEVQGLVKKYGKLTALDNISFSINKGEIFGLLGPNGAGKSTFISILTTISRPSSGDIIVSGFSASRQSDKIKKIIGYVPQDIALYPMLSGMDNLKFWAGMYGLKGSTKKERIKEVLSVVGLEDRIRDRVDTYSGGMKRRLNIAVSLLHHPEVLVMDEPTVGVDVKSRKLIFDAVKKLKEKNTTVIFTSHYIDEMEWACDRMAIINSGKLEALGTSEELKKSYNRESVEEILNQLNEE